MKLRKIKFPFGKTDPYLDTVNKLKHWENQKHRQGFETVEEANDFEIGDDTELDSVERFFSRQTPHQIEAAFGANREHFIKKLANPHADPSGASSPIKTASEEPVTPDPQ